jgi:molybdopterin molybdotransferase
VPDDPALIHEALKIALRDYDMILTTGGVSVGEYDYVKEILQKLNVQSHFWKVAIKPGKPFFFGSYGSKLVFGLPGNPVAVLLTFWLLIRPSIQQMMGSSPGELLKLRARLAKTIHKKPGRLEFVRAKLSKIEDELVVEPAAGQGSHMLGGLSMANSLIWFAQDADCLSAGDTVGVSLLHWELPA